MNKEHIVSWMRQVITIRGIVKQLEENLDSLRGNLSVAEALENTKHVATVETELGRMDRDYTKALTQLLQKTNKSNLDAVDQLLVDMNINVEMVDGLFEQWRRRKAQHELLASTNKFAAEPSENGITRVQMEEVIADAETQYRTGMELLSAFIPNKATLLHG